MARFFRARSFAAVLGLCAFAVAPICSAMSALQLISPPGAQTDSSVTLFWEESSSAPAAEFEVLLNGTIIATTPHHYYRAERLVAGRSFTFAVRHKSTPANVAEVVVATRPTPASVSIADFGAVADGTTVNTAMIQRAIAACPPHGKVVVPAGTYVTGALFLKSDMTLELERGATLRASHRLSDYPLVASRYEGKELPTFAALVNVGSMEAGAENVCICGEGTIDGQGRFLSAAQTQAAGRMKRSHGLLLTRCSRVYLRDFTIKDSPTWCIHPLYCRGVTTEHVTIDTDYGVPNADGWDPDSSTDCFLINSVLSTHDDDIAIKSGSDEEGRRIGLPSAHIRITGCLFNKGGGFAIGSEMSGGVHDVILEDSHFGSVDRGFNIKTRRKRGGEVSNIIIRNVTAERFGRWGVNFDMFYYAPDIPPQKPEATPKFRDVLFENITIERAMGPAITMDSLPESRIERVTFRHVTIRQADVGCTIANCDDVAFEGVSISPSEGPVWRSLRDNRGLRFAEGTIPP